MRSNNPSNHIRAQSINISSYHFNIKSCYLALYFSVIKASHSSDFLIAIVHAVNYDHNSPAFRPNKRQREVDANFMQIKLPVSLNHNFYNDESDLPSNTMNPHHVSTGLKLSYDDEERNSSITSASASMTLAPSIMSSIGDSITTELDRHKEDLESAIMFQVLFYSALQMICLQVNALFSLFIFCSL